MTKIYEIPIESKSQEPKQVKQKWNRERALCFKTVNGVLVKVELLKGESDGTMLVTLRKLKQSFTLPLENGQTLKNALSGLLDEANYEGNFEGDEDIDMGGIEE